MLHPENNDTYKGLSVNAGIEQPASVNPYLKHRHKKRELSVADYVDGIVRGDVTILSRAVTLVESIRPEHQAVAQEVIEKCLPYAGASIRVGISGVPGAGMVMLAMVLQSVGLPIEGIALVAGIDRVFDMGRTTVNITGDAACALIVSKMEDRKEARTRAVRG